MALSSTTVWEVRTTGSDVNGGGFRAGASGTDYSQQDAPQLSVADAAASGSATLTSVTGGFTTSMVGNIVQISGGTLNAGFYEITACSNTNTVTLDRTPGSGSGSTAAVGGALATPAKAVAAMVSANTVWVQAGNYTLSNQALSPPAGLTPALSTVQGYNTARGDLNLVGDFTGFPTIRKVAGTEPIFVLNGTGQRLRNLVLDGNGLATHGVNSTGGTGPALEKIKATGCTTFGISSLSNMTLLRCWSTANGPGAGGFNLSNAANVAMGCIASVNTGTGFTVGSGQMLMRCLSYNNAGASSHGFSFAGSSGAVLVHCVARSNGGDGMRIANPTALIATLAHNCIFVANGGFGINYTGGGTVTAWHGGNYNAFHGNTSGARTAALPAGPNDVTLVGDPFTNAAGGDFSLIAGGGGGQCRAAGYPGTLPSGLTIGAADIGAAQHADPQGAGQARIFGSGVIVGKGIQS